MKVTVVIPNYNGRHLLQKNLPNITVIKGISEVVVVDDGSNDGSVDFIKKNFPLIKLIEKVFNDGFATAVNLGVKAASGDVVILLNTDVVPKKDFLLYLLPHFKDPRIFAVGCHDESVEGRKRIARGRGIGKFTRGFLIHDRGEVDRHHTLWVAGGSGAFRKSIWEKLGGMDTLFDPFYWEDVDFSFRAQKAGYNVAFEPKAIVVHRHEEGVIKTHYTKTAITSISNRNQFIFVWKNITDVTLIMEHLLWLPYHLVTAIWRLDGAFVKGMLMALLKLPDIVKKRRLQAEFDTQTDRQVLSPYTNE